MQLTRHTDYALRTLIYLAGAGDRRVSIAEVAQVQDLSRTHLMKIVSALAHAGFLVATRGRGGGIRLARPPAQINIGAVVAAMEPGCGLVDCEGCKLIRKCGLPGVLNQALAAFQAALSEHTLAEILT